METGSIHNHTAPPFLMSPSDKLFPPPGSFNFSMAALADPNALASEYYFGMIFSAFLVQIFIEEFEAKLLEIFRKNHYYCLKNPQIF